VIQNLSSPPYAISFAIGYATGNFVGVQLEKRLAMGQQVIRIFTRKGEGLAELLRTRGYQLTVFDGKGRAGHVDLLFIECKRRDMERITHLSTNFDPDCYYIVDDVRESTGTTVRGLQPTGWRAVMKKK